MKFFDQRSSPCLTNLASQIGSLAADLALNVIEFADTLDSFRCDR